MLDVARGATRARYLHNGNLPVDFWLCVGCVNELGGHEDVACEVGAGVGEGDRVGSVEGIVCRGGSRGIVLGL